MSTPPQAIEKEVVSEILHANLLSILFLGAYTVVYLGTTYVYLTQKGPTSQRRVVLSAITLLYLLYLCCTLIAWYQVHYVVVDHGETRDSMFLALSMSPIWMGITGNALQDLMIAVSDGLMIWRCFHLWGGSWRVIFAPVVLTISELGLLIGLFIAYFRENGTAFDNINAALYFISAGATAMSTLLIGWRFQITSDLSTEDCKVTGSGRYRYLLLILFESAAIYAVCLIALAILTVLPPPTHLAAPITRATIYVSAITPAVTGIAPTILVARVVMAKSQSLMPCDQGPSVAFNISRTRLSAINFRRLSRLPGRLSRSNGQVRLSDMGRSVPYQWDPEFEGYNGHDIDPELIGMSKP